MSRVNDTRFPAAWVAVAIAAEVPLSPPNAMTLQAIMLRYSSAASLPQPTKSPAIC
ncbi:hypothetical protein C5N14_29105 [Micromonospora sp. MW-13]|nr:hypothetical protein C5N14_29105 [Micromonospora sp. MW-13]